MPSARNVAIPQAVACRFPCFSACAKTAIETAADDHDDEELAEPELGIDARRLRPKLERRSAVVARPVLHEEGNTSELARWDQVFPQPAGGSGLADLLVAGVHAAVVAPEDEVQSWFSWRAPASLLDELVGGGRLVRPEPG
jgi:hypothetical protein